MGKTLCLHIAQDAQNPNGYRAVLRAWPEQTEIASVLFDKGLIPTEGDDDFTITAIRERFATIRGEDDLFSAIGQKLFDLITQGDLAQHFQVAGADEEIVLDVEAEELRSLPWELMMRQNLPLFFQTQRRVYRGRLRPEINLPEFAWPLRILVVVGSAPNDPNVRAEDELSDLIHALIPIEAQVDLKILHNPTPMEIRKHCSGQPEAFNPHIFHFIGHGSVDGDESCLNLYDVQTRQEQVWTAADIQGLFAGAWKPRLVFVNACRSSDQSQEVAQSGLWSVTNAFLEAGAAAVLGIHTDIEGALAVAFSTAFYQGLARGESLDQAVAAGRQELWSRLSNARKRRDWAAPCLEVRALPQQVLQLNVQKEQQHWQRIRRQTVLRELPRLVDRHEDRWQAWKNLTGAQQHVYLLLGEQDVGKTRFAYQLLARCALCGFQTRYVDLRNEPVIDTLTLLRRISDGTPGHTPTQFLTGPLDKAAFDPFRAKVAQLLGQELSDQMRLTDVDRRDVEQIVASFRQGLEAVSAETRLVIAIDHWERMDLSQLHNFLLPYLFEWYLATPNQNITLLLLARPSDEIYSRQPNTSTLPLADYPTLPLVGFPKQRWDELAREFLRRLFKLPTKASDDEDDVVDMLLKVYGATVGPVWTPVALDPLEKFGKQHAQWPAADVGQ
ncbi:MAG: CHAT domain-containing protein [Caldilineaceae bacterium]|nr:CHAT domain-containing protein [Caldilineaceae bacterium]